MTTNNKNCTHLVIMFDKINDFNYCVDCEQVFIDDMNILEKESIRVEDDYENNLEHLNNDGKKRLYPIVKISNVE